MEKDHRGKKKLVNQHDLMTDVRQKINEVTTLQEKLKDLEWDCDILTNLIKCSVEEEVISVQEEFFSQVGLPETPIENLTILEKLLAYKFLGIAARETESGEMFVEYQPFVGHTPSLLSMVLLSKSDNDTYQMKDFNLPHNLPVGEMQEKYLNSEKNDVVAFVCALHRYVWAFWMRESYIFRIKKFTFLDKYGVYFNRSKTLITFQLDLVSEVKVETCLRYKSSCILPFDVSFIEMNDKTLSEEHQAALGELRESLMHYPFPEVLRTNFEVCDKTSKDGGQPQDNASSTGSTSTVVFDLFNKKS